MSFTPRELTADQLRRVCAPGDMDFQSTAELEQLDEIIGQEREVVLASAPHLSWPLRFVLPHDSHLRPAWMIRAGLFLYDHLATRRTLPASRKIDLRVCPSTAKAIAIR